MKKILILVFMFLFIENANAINIETQLIEAKKNIINLENKVTTFENEQLDKTYPIGTIYKTTTYSNVSQVQSVIGGKWEVYGSGRTLIGVNSSDVTFNVSSKTGGASTTTLSTSNLPSHTHSIPSLSGTAAQGATAATGGNHTHTVYIYFAKSGAGSTIPARTHYIRKGNVTWTSKEISGRNYMNGNSVIAASSGAHTHNVTTTASTTGSSGSGTSFTNLGPYITVYMYRRTA